MERIIYHADVDFCYAQIELLQHPEWVSRPLAVGGSRDDRHGIILAKCPRAKKAGVQTGIARLSENLEPPLSSFLYV